MPILPYAQSKGLFALPDEIKDTILWDNPESNRGFVKLGRERSTSSTDPDEIAELRRNAPDVKEAYDMGNNNGVILTPTWRSFINSTINCWFLQDPKWKNHWPPHEAASTFEPFMVNFFDTCHALHLEIMSAVALGLGLGLDEKYFDPLVGEAWHTLRLLNYPPMLRKQLDIEGQARVGAHSGNDDLIPNFEQDLYADSYG